MVELLTNLPPELKANVFRFQRHPCADMVRESFKMNQRLVNKHLTRLHKWFPDLTKKQMLLTTRDSEGQLLPTCMFRLHFLLHESRHKDMYKVVLRKVLAQTDTPFNDPFYVLEFLEEVFMQQHWERLLLFTPEESKEWAEEMVMFASLDDYTQNTE